MDIKIRPVRIEDAQAIARLEIQVMRIHAENAPANYRILPSIDGEQKIRFWKDNNIHAWVAVIKGEIVGYVSAEMRLMGMNDADTRVTGKEWCIDTLVVDSDYRSKGVGTALMRFMDEHAHAERVMDTAITVAAFNERARNLYERLGYVVTSYRMKKKF